MTSHADLSWNHVREAVSARLGLHFPVQRTPELRRGLAAAASALGMSGESELGLHLVSASLVEHQWQVLASHLTVGETYFMRGGPALDALVRHTLPQLIAKRSRQKQLRLWSAGCATGEEAYSLAIILRELLPDVENWRIALLATDINPQFLETAKQGVFGRWSFRGTPVGFRRRYFVPVGRDRFEVIPEIRQMVSFARLNLVAADFDEAASRVGLDPESVDLVLCRNVLMYFSTNQAILTTRHIHRRLTGEGWLAVAPCETACDFFRDFVRVTVAGSSLYCKGQVSRGAQDGADNAAIRPWPKPVTYDQRFRGRSIDARPAATLRNAGRPKPPPESPRTPKMPSPSVHARRARAFADQGQYSEALECCDRWIEYDKMNAAAHQLRAMVLMEMGNPTAARNSLQRAVYLVPESPMAHFALGSLEQAAGCSEPALHHYLTTRDLLDRYSPDTVLDPAAGITANQLRGAVDQLIDACCQP